MNVKRHITTGVITAGIAAAAIGGTVAAAPEAAAGVPGGTYTMYDNTGSAKVTLYRNTLYAPNARFAFHQTRNGGYIDVGATRYLLTRHGNTYSGPIMLGPLTIGSTKLVPR
ncbi:hypothetical protein [Gordonia sp. 1D]|uniref:hypothetical protein n=1 Tax=Gordonia sp. 1D TaxID=1737359 RepID=UPI000BB82A5F|nr:hypothetical protein [Gordonia sp. 1D]ATD71723.1 hypothetical protein CNO18_17120 [Gordonia sp. 1D]